VNSYHDLESMGLAAPEDGKHVNSTGFSETYKLRDGSGVRFAELMDRVSDIAPEVRFRFTSPHPKDFPDSFIDVVSSKANVCS